MPLMHAWAWKLASPWMNYNREIVRPLKTRVRCASFLEPLSWYPRREARLLHCGLFLLTLRRGLSLQPPPHLHRPCASRCTIQRWDGACPHREHVFQPTVASLPSVYIPDNTGVFLMSTSPSNFRAGTCGYTFDSAAFEACRGGEYSVAPRQQAMINVN